MSEHSPSDNDTVEHEKDKDGSSSSSRHRSGHSERRHSSSKSSRESGHGSERRHSSSDSRSSRRDERREKERGRNDRDRDREGSRRDKDKHGGKDRDKHGDKERDKGRDKHGDKDRDKYDKDRDRHDKHGDKDKHDKDRDAHKDKHGNTTERDNKSDSGSSANKTSHPDKKRARDDQNEPDEITQTAKKPRYERTSTGSNASAPSDQPALVSPSSDGKNGEDDVAAAKKKKLLELANLLKKQKEQLEKEKQTLEKKKKQEEDERRRKEREVEQKKIGIEGVPELRLNDMGQQVDVHGRPIAAQIIRRPTLLINKKALEKKAEPVKPSDLVPLNKYFDPTSSLKTRKKKRGFNWVQPGTFVKQAEEMRQLNKEEELQAQAAAKPPGEEEGDAAEQPDDEDQVDTLIREERKAFIGKIPLVEWWDKPFLKPVDGSQVVTSYGEEGKPIPVDDSTIDSNIFHPVPLKPAAEPPAPPPQPLPLTRKEQHRITKQTREANRQAEIDEILIGAKDAPPPRVRLANIPRVFSQQAMQDPTAIEVMVQDEMLQRENRHIQRNQSRKLTKEQRREKKKTKALEDTSLYTHVAVYKVLVLRDLNRYKIDMNAQQSFLKGCCLMIPTSFNLVVVEGGPKALRKYKKLMLRRIKWNAPDLKKGGEAKKEDPAKNQEPSDPMEIEEGKEQDKVENADTSAEKKDTDVHSNDSNATCCYLVWEGEVLQGAFHEFQMKNLKSEVQARKFLMDRGCVHYWDMAKNFIPPPKAQTV